MAAAPALRPSAPGDRTASASRPQTVPAAAAALGTALVQTTPTISSAASSMRTKAPVVIGHTAPGRLMAVREGEHGSQVSSAIAAR